MVALVKRVSRLENKLADRSQTGHLSDKVVYQPDERDLVEVMAILI